MWSKCFQSNNTHLAASWKGFSDAESFVSRYEWCIGRSASASDCSLQPWQSVGLHTHVRATLDASTLAHAQLVFMRVRASNQVPSSLSPVVTGCGLLIDRTPPYLASGCSPLPGHVTNWDFTKSASAAIAFKDLKASWWKGRDPTAPEGWRLSGAEAAAVLVTTPFSQAGGKFVLLKGALSQTVRTVIGRPYMLLIHVSDVANWQAKAMRQGFVRVGSIVRQSFEIQARKAEHRHIHWFKKLYFFRATETETKIELGTMPSDLDGLGFDAVTLAECRASSGGVNAIYAQIEQVMLVSKMQLYISVGRRTSYDRFCIR